MEIPQQFVIRESGFRIHDPFDDQKLAALGRALRLRPGMTLLDLACGGGEALCTWARDYGVTGKGVDMSATFIADASRRANELGVADRVTFDNADAAGHVAEHPCDVAMCMGATWIADGLEGTIQLLKRSLKPGGLIVVGEPFFNDETPTPEVLNLLGPGAADEFSSLPRLIERIWQIDCDLVEMVLATPDSWDRYVAAQWLNIRRWLDANPDHPLHDEMATQLRSAPIEHVRVQRTQLGWGCFVLMPRS